MHGRGWFAYLSTSLMVAHHPVCQVFFLTSLLTAIDCIIITNYLTTTRNFQPLSYLFISNIKVLCGPLKVSLCAVRQYKTTQLIRHSHRMIWVLFRSSQPNTQPNPVSDCKIILETCEKNKACLLWYLLDGTSNDKLQTEEIWIYFIQFQ